MPGSTEPLNEAGAAAEIRARLPEFAPDIDEHLAFNGELLLHLLMGDLARWYVKEALEQSELKRRVWMTIDWLDIHGDWSVQNAIGVSFIEWFAWGSDQDRAILIEAKPLMSSTIRAITDEFLRPRPDDERGRSKR
jgi:hypothetical protein